MKTPSVGTLVSLALNVILSLWLVDQYFYDIYFKSYVDSTLGPVYPFIILTMGLGGGSGLGYLLLRRRHPGKSQVGRGQIGPFMRHTTFPSTPASLASTSQSKNPPSGKAPGQPSKHTVYAVPPLAKSSVSSVQRTSSSTLWSTVSKQPTLASGPSSLQRSESAVTVSQQAPPQPSPQTLKADQAGRPQVTQPQVQRPDQSQPRPTARPSVEPFTRPGPESQWKPETLASAERKSEADFVHPKPPMESLQKADTPSLGQRPLQTAQPSPAFPTPKWQPPDTGTKPGQWTDPVPKQPTYSPPQKWAPPPGASATPQTRPPVIGPLGPMQPPLPRPSFPPSQGPPRPVAYPGLPRPPESGSGPGPRPFRPDQTRPTPGPGVQPRPALQGQRLPSTQWGPTLSLASQEKREPTGVPPPQSQPTPTTTRPQPTPVSTRTEPVEWNPSEGSSAGEMDWDTALDTILKTLRKDKLVEKP